MISNDHKQPRFRFLSWGCGVQSTVLGEMAAQGILEPLDAIITADTGWERGATYKIRDWYTARWQSMGLRVEIVSAGDVRQLGATEHIHIPFWTSDGGPLQRQCTRHFKIIPIKRTMRKIAGYHPSKPPHPKPKEFEVWLGISLDEWHRAKRHPPLFAHERWPLLELTMTREDCITWLKQHDLPVPVKSACIGCPYRHASEWIAMRNDAPDEFAEAVMFDEKNRINPLAACGVSSTADFLYIYKSNKSNGPEPLRSADLEYDAAHERRIANAIQIPMMLCESGYCWV